MNLRALVLIGTALLLLTLPVANTRAGTDVSGVYCPGDTWEWTVGGSPYNLMGDVTFCETATLRIKAGVEVHSHGYNTLIMEGRLEALGKPDKPILMRSGEPTPAAGDWGGIQLLQDAAGGTSISRIQNVKIRHADWAVRVVRGSHEIGPGNIIEDFAEGGINVTCDGQATPYIHDNLIRQREPSLYRTGTGVRCHHNDICSDPRPVFDISENTFTALNTAVSLGGRQTYSWPCAGVWGGPDPRVMSNCFEDNNTHLNVASYSDHGTRYVRAQENWWGSTDPVEIEAMISPVVGNSWVPHVNFTRVAASCGGELLSGYVRGYIRTYENWRDFSVPYYLIREITVGDEATLEIDPGVHVFVNPGATFRVHGRLESYGTVDQPIVFESGAEMPAAGDWPGLDLRGPLGTPAHGPLPSTIAHTIIRHANWGITTRVGNTTIGPANLIEDFLSGGVSINGDFSGTLPDIQYNTIRQADPSLQGNGTGIECHETDNVDHRPVFFVSGNVVTDVNHGVSLSGYEGTTIHGGPDVTVSDNCFDANDGKHLRTANYQDAATRTVDAERNWWGTTNPAEIAALIRDQADNANAPTVDSDPWKTAPDCLQDIDGDGASAVVDCDDDDIDVWQVPGEARTVSLTPDGVSLNWSAPGSPGGNHVLYDVIRSDDAGDFGALAICIEWDDGADTQATDPDLPAPGSVFSYLVRAENDCGQGAPGDEWDGTERDVRPCS